MADKAPRDWIIDIARVASMLVVVLMHWTWQRVTYVDGQIQLENSLNGGVMVTLTWVLMVMPLFFIAGGFANTLIVDRCRRRGESYGQFLGLRARRLFTPLLPLLVVFTLIGLVTPSISAGVARTAAKEPANVLWFLAVYVICTALAPLQVWMHDRLGWWVGPALWLALAAWAEYADAHRLIDGTWKMLAVWPACHALGVLYQRRTLRRAPAWLLVAAAVALAGLLYGLVALGWIAPQNIGLAGRDRQNLMPPSVALALLGVVQLCLLVPLARRFEGWQPGRRAERAILTLNAMLMHLYLWHVPVLVTMVGVAMLDPGLLLPSNPALWWAERLIWLPLGAALLFGIVRVATAWDLFMHRFPARGNALVAVAASTLGCVGIYVIWKHGISPQPTSLLATGAVAATVAALTVPHRERVEAPLPSEPAVGASA